MTGLGRLLAVFLCLSGFLGFAGPANAFELFGFSFFESAEEEEAADVIDPLPYEATLDIVGADQSARESLQSASLLLSRQKIPPSGTVGLISRAQDDRLRLVAALYEAGRYGGVVDITIAGRPIDRIDLTERLSRGTEPVQVKIKVEPGPVFLFGKVRAGRTGAKVDEAFIAGNSGLVGGDVAKSTIVLDAEAALLTAWGEVGHPFAKVAARRVTADHGTKTVDVLLRIDPGPEAVFGSVTVEGAERLDPDFLARHADIPEGQTYDSRQLERARRNLARIEALGSIAIRPAERLTSGRRLPIVIEVSERKRHVIGGGATFSSTEGAEVQAYWKHRNLFGRGEVLRLEGAIGRLLEADAVEDLDARALAEFHVPGVFDPHTDLDLTGGFVREDPDTFNREAVIFKALVSERRTDHLTFRAGAEFDLSWIDETFATGRFTLVGAPLIGEYDTRDDPLNATEGWFLRLTGEPFLEVEEGAAFFLANAEARHYRALDDDGRFVLAVRGQIGTLAGTSLDNIPAHRRFYAGGAGSVRGYDLYGIGPSAGGFDATGGRSRIEGSAEARIRVTETIGIVPFFDAGFVSEDADFSGGDAFQAGVGIGLRYYTAVGPIRLDVAVPVNPRADDPDVAFYLGIGQAF